VAPARCGQRAAALASTAFPAQVTLLPHAARVAAGALRAFARGSLLWMAAAWTARKRRHAHEHAGADPHFRRAFLAPEAAAWCVLLASPRAHRSSTACSC
jgi:apolipoprotein N-acyltransferase